MRLTVLPLLLCSQITYIYSTILTNPFRCFIWDTACVTALAQHFGPGYIQSLPELSTKRLDPMEIKNLHVEINDNIMDIKDTKVHGLQNLVIDEIRSYSNISLGRVLVRTDLVFTGLYKTNGSVLFKPVSGEGDYWVSLKNLELELFVPYDIVKDEKGTEFIDASNYNFRFDVLDDAQFRFDNLYYGNTELSELMHSLVNSNWKFVTSEYGRPFISRVVDSIAQAYKGYFRLAPLKSLVEL